MLITGFHINIEPNLELIVSVKVYRVTSKILVLSVVINVECVDHCSCEEDDLECC